MATIRIKRGTRAQVTAAAGSNALQQGEPYLITDAARLAIGTGSNTTLEFVPAVVLTETEYDVLDPPVAGVLYIVTADP